MKLWYGYGSEHSMNLVMIGRFKDAGDATKAKEVIDRITEQVGVEIDADRIEVGEQTDRYSDDMLTLLGSDVNVHGIYPAELEQFVYDVSVEVEDDKMLCLQSNRAGRNDMVDDHFIVFDNDPVDHQP